jgi:hypothetical protein
MGQIFADEFRRPDSDTFTTGQSTMATLYHRSWSECGVARPVAGKSTGRSTLPDERLLAGLCGVSGESALGTERLVASSCRGGFPSFSILLSCAWL